MSEPCGDLAQLRGLVLAVSVLDDLDLDPCDDGVLLATHHVRDHALLPRAAGANAHDHDQGQVRVAWSAVREAIGEHDPGSGVARRRLADWLRLRALVAELGDQAGTVLRLAARALALPRDHACHPGPAWVREPLLGGALECGVAVLGVLDDPAQVLPLPPGVARCTGVDAGAWWPTLREHAEGMGHLAVQRLRRDAGPRQLVLRPVGGVDVPTLLVSPALRHHLAEGDGSGMRAIAVPMRSRGWFDLARIDPAFVAAAWSATAEHERGLPRPLLVTADEVTLGPDGGDVREALADPVVDDAWRHDVRYR